MTMSRQSEERAAHLERQLSQKELTVAALEHDRRTLRSEVRSLQNLVQATPALGARVGSTQSVLLRKPPGDREQDFGFDRVFGPDAGQRDLYEEVEPLLPGILRGLHLCVFAYGQTGSGKTYTLSGRPGGEGGLTWRWQTSCGWWRRTAAGPRTTRG
ncbi:unnamed protein product [Prorocentrum cordatum]|uniref:Kinesin motor domain-containing protein n=1 Tax=Prorocentrum cordatum TaxID=2364126 RepID=A0ABN9Y647_9DINO|nr:unnamed protein product [Polarella glacialis]